MLLHMSALSFRVAILRPPLVYGPRVKGNMIKLLQLADKNYPLPFGNIQNRRSMVYVDNLVELINAIVQQQATGIYIAADEQPVSTELLVRTIRKELNKPGNMISLPLPFRILLRTIKPALFTRLYGSYIIDNTHTNKRLHFHPPFSTQSGIRQMVQWYKETESRK